jgi:hypothetical protein
MTATNGRPVFCGERFHNDVNAALAVRSLFYLRHHKRAA